MNLSCPTCGSPNRASAGYCARCGSPLSDSRRTHTPIEAFHPARRRWLAPALLVLSVTALGVGVWLVVQFAGGTNQEQPSATAGVSRQERARESAAALGPTADGRRHVAEAWNLLEELKTLEWAYFQQYGRFTANISSLGFSVPAGTAFSYSVPAADASRVLIVASGADGQTSGIVLSLTLNSDGSSRRTENLPDTVATRKHEDAVAATVNGVPIYWSQVDAEVARAAAQFGLDPKSQEFGKQRGDLTKAVIDQLITTQLVMQEARKRNIVATDQEVDAQLAAIKQRFPGEAEFNSALARNNQTPGMLRDLLRVQITQQRVAEIVAPRTVSDDEVRGQFDNNRSLYDKPAQIRVSHILFRIAEKGEESVAAAKARAAQAKLAEGAKFEDVARQYSEDPGSATQGGDLGYVSRGTLVKEFEAVAWALKPGETSPTVRTQYGLHIVRVFDVKAAERASFEQVKGEIRLKLLASKREKAFEEWLGGKRRTSRIELFERR